LRTRSGRTDFNQRNSFTLKLTSPSVENQQIANFTLGLHLMQLQTDCREQYEEYMAQYNAAPLFKVAPYGTILKKAPPMPMPTIVIVDGGGSSPPPVYPISQNAPPSVVFISN
jgi:hypothetical protein